MQCVWAPDLTPVQRSQPRPAPPSLPPGLLALGPVSGRAVIRPGPRPLFSGSSGQNPVNNMRPINQRSLGPGRSMAADSRAGQAGNEVPAPRGGQAGLGFNPCLLHKLQIGDRRKTDEALRQGGWGGARGTEGTSSLQFPLASPCPPYRTNSVLCTHLCSTGRLPLGDAVLGGQGRTRSLSAVEPRAYQLSVIANSPLEKCHVHG